MKRSAIILSVLILIIISGCNDDNGPEKKGSIAGNHVYAVFIDENGIKWFGTDKGLSAFDGEKWTTYSDEDYLADNQVRDIAFQMSQYGPEIWVATGAGACVLAIELDAITSATSYTTSNSGIIGNDVLSVGLDTANNRWFGTDAGISVFAGQDWSSTHHAGTLSEHPVIDIGSDHEGYTFLATQGAGVAVMEYVDAITTVTYYEFPWSPVPESGIIYSVYVDSEGNQWYGTPDGLLEHRSREAKTDWILYNSEDDGLPGDEILSITGDQNGDIWIGTLNAGVSKYDGSAWTIYSTNEGLADNKVFAIAVDIDGSVWFGTDNGVSHFAGGTWTTYRSE